ncbi:ankyrin repeat domain-containing protein 26 isoform B [Alligator mississippiensis]|uniref:Ankyrin repeat domain-containing protein 26 isoform B n=1 Tax=Alligator mississippiensis TaxID=8496 RepID=A0A151PF67_ALLMI|nr:ankyrin repeat domain-containing protein 26 isoform B [Alligator mississippiensis]
MIKEEHSETQKQLSQEKSARALQEGILNNHLRRQKEMEKGTRIMIAKSSEVPDNHDREKDLLHKNQMLQNEIAILRLELDQIRIRHQEEETKYLKENVALKEKNEGLKNELDLNEEALTQTVFEYNGQLNVLKTESTMLTSKIEQMKENKDRLETELESFRSRLNSAVQELERCQASKSDVEQMLQREHDEWLHLQDKFSHDLSNLQETNNNLSQQLNKAENKINSLENELHQVMQTLKEKTFLLESTQRELNQAQCQAKEHDHAQQMEKDQINKYIVKQEAMQERLAQLQSENLLFRQQLEDMQSKGIIKEKVVSDIQDRFNDISNKLRADTEKQVHMIEERNHKLITKCNNLKEQVFKYETEKVEREGMVRQLQQELADALKKQSIPEASLDAETRYQNNLEKDKVHFHKEINGIKSKFESERKKVKKLVELKQSVEAQLDQEMKRNSELQKKIKKLLKTDKKNLKEYETTETESQFSFQGELKNKYSEMDSEVSRLRTKVEELSQQLEIESKNSMQLERTNHDLQEQLSSMKILSKNHEKLQKNKWQLEEEVANLKCQVEMNMMKRNQIEQYKREIEERARQEMREKLGEVNLFLQTQAASQEKLEQIRETNNASLRNQLEHRIRDLESELGRMKNTQQDSIFQKESTQTELERYKNLYAEEIKIRKCLASKLERANERLAEANAKLLHEHHRSKSLIASNMVNGSPTASPVLDTAQLGNLGNNLALNRSLGIGSSFINPTGNSLSSKNRVEASLAKKQKTRDTEGKESGNGNRESDVSRERKDIEDLG